MIVLVLTKYFLDDKEGGHGGNDHGRCVDSQFSDDGTKQSQKKELKKIEKQYIRRDYNTFLRHDEGLLKGFVKKDVGRTENFRSQPVLKAKFKFLNFKF